MKSEQISEDVIQHKADAVGAMLNGYRRRPDQALVSSAASFIHHGYITEVEKMLLRNVNLSEVAHASALADVTVTDTVFISNVTGNIAPVISRIKCRWLDIDIRGIDIEREILENEKKLFK